MKKYTLAFVVIITLQNFVHAQARFLQTPCATTAQNTVGNFIISYTIGEMPIIQTFKNSGLFLTNGIIQPEVSNADAGGTAFGKGEITIYPNPTPNNLFIQYNILEQGKLSLQLYNALGQRIFTDEIIVNSFSTKKYDLAKYAADAYILKVLFTGDNGNTIKKGKYKIIKI
jgi:hypothetical protein